MHASPWEPKKNPVHRACIHWLLDALLNPGVVVPVINQLIHSIHGMATIHEFVA